MERREKTDLMDLASCTTSMWQYFMQENAQQSCKKKHLPVVKADVAAVKQVAKQVFVVWRREQLAIW